VTVSSIGESERAPDPEESLLAAVVLTDRLVALPSLNSRLRAVVLVVGGALLTAAAARFTIHLPWTPVPITGQTFSVLLVGGALGWRLGSLSMALYVGVSALGLPFYAQAADGSRGGWDVATGPTAGYLVGFVLAAALVGWLAERGQDRRLDTSCPRCSQAPPSSTSAA